MASMPRSLPGVSLAVIGMLALLLASCGQPGPQFRNVDITGADYGKDFRLTDHTGKIRQLADFRGKAVVLFFGYTQCPDVCPATMSELALVMKALGDGAKQVQVVFVTLDPERDSVELLAQYVPAFNPDFLGLRGDDAATRETAKAFRVFYQKQPGAAPGSYSIDHTAGSYVFDKLGRLRLFVRYGAAGDVGVGDLAADLRVLLAQQ
jgi:protein SCO1/2